MRESPKPDSVLFWVEDEFIDYGTVGTPKPDSSPDQWPHVRGTLSGANNPWNFAFEEVARARLSGRSWNSTLIPTDQPETTETTHDDLGDKSDDTSFEITVAPEILPAFDNDNIKDQLSLQAWKFPDCNHESAQPMYIDPSVLHSPSSFAIDSNNNMVPSENTLKLQRASKPRVLAPARPQKMTRSVTKPMRVTKRTTRPKSARPCDIKKENRKTEKPLRCSSCNEGFAWKRDLVRHCEVRHTGGAPRTRVVCPYPNCLDRATGKRMTFSRKDHVVRHVKNKHA